MLKHAKLPCDSDSSCVQVFDPSLKEFMPNTLEVEGKYVFVQVGPDFRLFINKTVGIKISITLGGFGGKRAVGFLLKIELCRKRSKFRMQFCLGALNNVLYVFLLKFSSFTRYYVCKKACICGFIST